MTSEDQFEEYAAAVNAATKKTHEQVVSIVKALHAWKEFHIETYGKRPPEGRGFYDDVNARCKDFGDRQARRYLRAYNNVANLDIASRNDFRSLTSPDDMARYSPPSPPPLKLTPAQRALLRAEFWAEFIAEAESKGIDTTPLRDGEVAECSPS